MSALPAEFCRIERWRGYVASSFTVRLPDGTVLESPRFRWRHAAPPPATAPARAAYGELVRRLEAAGWTRHADGADWFATTFMRLAESAQELPLQSEREVLPAELEPLAPPPVPSERPNPDLPAAGEPRAPEPPPAPGAGRRRSRLALAAVGALVAAALASALVVLLGDGGDRSRKPASRPTARVRSTTTSPARAGAATSPASAAASRPVVDLRLAARGGGSWVEVRRASPTGPVLYRATLAGGQTLHLRAPKLWARFGAASNLTITSDGRPVELRGTYDKLFVPTG